MKKNYLLWRLSPLTRDQFKQLSLREKLLFLCKLGQLAPSSHNVQPWRFFLNESDFTIDIYLDRNFILPASDAAGRQSLVSIGCAVENMVIGASYLNGSPRVEIVASKKKTFISYKISVNTKGRYMHLVRFHYTTTKPPLALEHLYKSIFTRKVMRAEYDLQRPLSFDIIKQLRATTDEKITKLHVITDAIRRFSVAEFQGQADGFVINSPRFSKELGAWLLPNDTNLSLGMPGAGFGLQDNEATRLHHGLLGISMLEPEDGLKFALAGKLGMEKSPFNGCITIPKDNIAYWIKAGQSFERMFLILESHGISVAVHAGMIEVALVNRIFAATLGTLRRPAVLFRAGMVKNKKDKERPHSPRLSLENVLLEHRP